MYSSGINWKAWMRDFKFGTLAFIPNGEVRNVCDRLRAQFDPVSAKTCSSHITITQPFVSAPSNTEIESISVRLNGLTDFNVEIGPATTSPNKRLLWMDVQPKDRILQIREALHESALFRTDLPLTKGFIPHLTISEQQREPEEVNSIIAKLNAELSAKFESWSVRFDKITWIVPDDDFIFREHQSFRLS